MASYGQSENLLAPFLATTGGGANNDCRFPLSSLSHMDKVPSRINTRNSSADRTGELHKRWRTGLGLPEVEHSENVAQASIEARSSKGVR